MSWNVAKGFIPDGHLLLLFFIHSRPSCCHWLSAWTWFGKVVPIPGSQSLSSISVFLHLDEGLAEAVVFHGHVAAASAADQMCWIPSEPGFICEILGVRAVGHHNHGQRHVVGPGFGQQAHQAASPGETPLVDLLINAANKDATEE